jgi:predicted Mrr-cat superfamily restriction endonuclease
MKHLIRQILIEETEKRSNDLFEIIVKQDIINSDTRKIDRKAIDQLISKLVRILSKCTNNQEGEYLYQIRNIKHESFNTDIVYHRLIYIGNDLGRYFPCVQDKILRLIRMNHDKGEIILLESISDNEINSILKDIPKNSTYRDTWTKDKFFEFYHAEMIELTTIPFFKIQTSPMSSLRFFRPSSL